MTKKASKKGFENNPQNINLDGRPTEYDPKYIKKVDDYLKQCRDKKRLFHKVRGEKSDSYEEVIKVKLPSVEDFAGYLGVTRQTIYNWRDAHDDFGYVLEKIDNEQRTRLINGGLEGTYSPVISKLMLSSNHGMREKSDLTSDDKPIKTFSDETIERIAQRITGRGRNTGDTAS